MVKHVKNPRFWLGTIVLVWLSLILTTPNSQPAIAQPKITELNPPFKFVEADRQPLVAVRPPGSTVIMTETFGAGFNPVTAVTGTVPLWRKVVNPTDTAGYYWGRVGSGAFVNTAWSAVAQATAGLPYSRQEAIHILAGKIRGCFTARSILTVTSMPRWTSNTISTPLAATNSCGA